MNDTDEVPEIAVVLNNLGRVSLVFLFFFQPDEYSQGIEGWPLASAEKPQRVIESARV